MKKKKEVIIIDKQRIDIYCKSNTNFSESEYKIFQMPKVQVVSRDNPSYYGNFLVYDGTTNNSAVTKTKASAQ